MGPLPSMGWPSAIDHAADHGFAHRHGHDAAGAPDFVAFLDFGVVAQQHRADLVFFQVQGDAGDAVRELDQFARHHLFQAVNARDAVAHRDHEAGLGDIDGLLVILDLLAQHPRDFICSNLSHKKACFNAETPRSRRGPQRNPFIKNKDSAALCVISASLR